MKKTLTLILCASLFFSAPVWAYIDPGSGSAIMSAIIGFFVALGLAVKTWWYKLTGWFSRDKHKPDNHNFDDPAP